MLVLPVPLAQPAPLVRKATRATLASAALRAWSVQLVLLARRVIAVTQVRRRPSPVLLALLVLPAQPDQRAIKVIAAILA
ncbi:hypothetical protein [Sphingobium lactosutens]|uniref:hypothetical protein n=1 Tax=Sphingobium lactosutens TaxID=522773 RepID=UPI001C4BA8F0|nr:hypothetical protein [Sphingobium lactosutens]